MWLLFRVQYTEAIDCSVQHEHGRHGGHSLCIWKVVERVEQVHVQQTETGDTGSGLAVCVQNQYHDLGTYLLSLNYCAK
jgi:hypothetical protein